MPVPRRLLLYRCAIAIALGCFLRRSAAFFTQPGALSRISSQQVEARQRRSLPVMEVGRPPVVKVTSHPSALSSQRMMVRRHARMLGPELIEEVKSSVSIVEVMSQYVDLKEMKEMGGGKWQCRCPFHDDQVPSMGVDEDKGLYHCFGCGAKGDAVEFMSQVAGFSFMESMETLAEMGGVTLPEEDVMGGVPPKNHTRLYMVLDAAADYYAQMIMEGPGGMARSHLSERRISPSVAADFQLGLSPLQPGGLFKHLLEMDFTEAEMVEAGLFSPNAIAAGNGTPFDRFYGRLIIPIHNPKGQVVGFGARQLRDEPSAKYLNTGNTPVFKKNALLFGLHRARASIREQKVAIVAEGYFDVIALHGAGVRHVVGSMGTAISTEHMRALRNALPEDGTIVICLDGDAAGQRAMERACREVFLSMDGDDRSSSLIIKIATLTSPYKDPADLCMDKGTSAGDVFLREVVQEAVAWKEWYGLRLMDGFQAGDTASFSRASEALTEFLSSLPATKQADRTFLSARFAERVFPNNAALQEQLTADLIQQTNEKSKRRSAAPPRGAATNSRAASPPPSSQAAPAPPASAPPSAPSSPPEPRPPVPRQAPPPMPAANAAPVQRQQQHKGPPPPAVFASPAPPATSPTNSPRPATIMAAAAAAPPPSPPSRPLTQHQQRPRPPQQQQPPPAYLTSQPPPARIPPPPPPQQQLPPPPQHQATAMMTRAPSYNAPPPSPPPPAAPRGPLTVTAAEESILRLAITDVDIRAVLHELFAGRQLFLSTKAHQTLYDWLFRQPRGLILEDDAEVMAGIFVTCYPAFRGLRSYFMGGGHKTEEDRIAVAELPVRLACMVEASIAERALRETREWSRRLQRVEIQYTDENSNYYLGDGATVPPPQQPRQQVMEKMDGDDEYYYYEEEGGAVQEMEEEEEMMMEEEEGYQEEEVVLEDDFYLEEEDVVVEEEPYNDGPQQQQEWVVQQDRRYQEDIYRRQQQQQQQQYEAYQRQQQQQQQQWTQGRQPPRPAPPQQYPPASPPSRRGYSTYQQQPAAAPPPQPPPQRVATSGRRPSPPPQYKSPRPPQQQQQPQQQPPMRSTNSTGWGGASRY